MTVPLARLVESLSTTGGWAEVAGAGDAEALLVELDGTGADTGLVASLPRVLIGLGDASDVGAALVDLVLPDAGAAAEPRHTVERTPIAATALALLLRGAEQRSVPDGLVAESSSYSTLQAGPEHAAWLRGNEAAPRPARAEPVQVRREGDELHLTLNRPEVRNAFDAATRDALLDALAVAGGDPQLRVVIDGAGPSFCSGGDLAEFGTLADPGSAHLLRLGRSVGLALHRLADRVRVDVHGACIGAGVELPAFVGQVVAAPDATFALPEVGMGLVPGAGGTVSITRRIGRHRTAWLALTGSRLAAEDALGWGLVDEVTGLDVASDRSPR